VQIQGDSLFKLIPQRPPMVMIDALLDVSDDSALCTLAISNDNIFCSKEGLFEEAGLIEHIAQSAAAMVGYEYYKQNQPAPIGFIASVDRLECFYKPATGSVIETKITTIQRVSDIMVVSGVVTERGNKVAQCNMKFYINQGKGDV